MERNIERVGEVFLDFDLFRSVLLGWDVDVTQLSSGPLELGWKQLTFDSDLTLSHLQTNRSLCDQMSIDHDRVTFVVCFTRNIFCGLEVPEGTMLIFGGGREYRSVLFEGFESFEISASVERLRDFGLGETGFELFDFAPENCCIPLLKSETNAYRGLAKAVSQLANPRSGSESDGYWAGAAREQALNLTVSVLQRLQKIAVLQGAGTKQLSGWQLAIRAIERIDEHRPEKVLTISQLAQMLCCAPRTLQVAFRNTLGITPLQYQLARRLNLVRQDLLNAHYDRMTVTELATAYNFNHFGRFAQYYSNLFGELPSSTLNRLKRL